MAFLERERFFARVVMAGRHERNLLQPPPGFVEQVKIEQQHRATLIDLQRIECAGPVIGPLETNLLVTESIIAGPLRGASRMPVRGVCSALKQGLSGGCCAGGLHELKQQA
jgi:hypothetical protein